MSVRHNQQDLKYWHTWGEFPHECYVIRQFTLPNLSEYSQLLQTFNSDFGTDASGETITLFRRGEPTWDAWKRKTIWKGRKEEFKIAIQGGGEFYELGLYGLHGPITERDWNQRVSNAIADLLLKGGEYAPPCWTLSEEPLSKIPDRDLFGHSMVPV